MVHHAVVGRLMQEAQKDTVTKKVRWSFTTTLRDTANAFPSLAHDAMDDNLRQTADSHLRQQLKARHELLQVRIRNKDGDTLVIHPNTGGGSGR